MEGKSFYPLDLSGVGFIQSVSIGKKDGAPIDWTKERLPRFELVLNQPEPFSQKVTIPEQFISQGITDAWIKHLNKKLE